MAGQGGAPIARAAGVFDVLQRAFDSARHRRLLSLGLATAFLLALAGIELSARGLLGPELSARLPHTHFHAIELAFNLLLAYEVTALVFAIARSVANAAGKQFEIFSLILLRHSFEPFASLDEPVRWEAARPAVLQMASFAGGALLIFAGLGFYYASQKHRPLSADREDRESFIATKKAIALVLLASLAFLAARSGWGLMAHLEPSAFFEPFYTLLVFADVLIVLISLRYSASYHVVFRNSGLTVATVMLRLALTAPPPWISVVGAGAMAFVIALSAAYHRVSPVFEQVHAGKSGGA
ncbi:MAG: hypothetical protein JNK82_23855 [Myxococcaceae bacterium]|nr:hypothetical protein [Myxococcaceae bacterium]